MHCLKPRFRCVCRCDGSYECPARHTINLCPQGSVTRGRPQTTTPVATVTAKKMGHEETTAAASIEGTDSSTTGDGNDRRTSRRQRQCSGCMAGGIERKGHSYFELIDDCTKFKYCICRCGGEWSCPNTHTENICNDESSNSPVTVTTIAPRPSRRPRPRPRQRCGVCEVEGQQFRGHSRFDITIGCIHYKYCTCRCNGKWSCPAGWSKNICDDNQTSKPVATTTTLGPTTPPLPTRPSPRCRGCEANGQLIPRRGYFQMTEGCSQHRRCICRCDGSWSCDHRYTRNICDTETTTVSRGRGRGRGGCKSCNIGDKEFSGNSSFDLQDGCTYYDNCICRCDGSWSCPSEYAENVCSSATSFVQTTTPLTNCVSCLVKGNQFQPNTKFELVNGCLKYIGCDCKCDGSWECYNGHYQNICINTTTDSPVSILELSSTNAPFPATPSSKCVRCLAKGRVIQPNTKFDMISNCTFFTGCDCRCDGSWECYGDQAQNICRNTHRNKDNTDVDGNTDSDLKCRMCTSRDGRRHRPKTRFSLVEECIEYNCNCFCDGRWSCPASKSRWICPNKCKDCDVDGRRITNGTVFRHSTGCLEYTCSCHCNGSWSCPASSVANTCSPGVNNNCNRCQVSETDSYEGETDFHLRRGCLHYQCRCNCDGSWNCPAETKRNECHGEILGGCRSCVLSESEFHPGESNFMHREDCLNFECRCNCDGSWNCPAEKTRNVCIGEVPGGCRVCQVYGEIHRANSMFDLKRGCMNYNCRCNCDGSWKCPGETARDVCKLEVPGGCRSCILSETEFYRGNSNFEMTKDCIHYKCRCNCDGGYSCPGSTARRVCGIKSRFEEPSCQKCVVSKSEIFEGNSTFFFEKQCLRFKCKCNCDGSWECPTSDSKNICIDRHASPAITNSKCTTCRVGNNIFPADTSFKFTNKCNQYTCACDCIGRWTCDHLNRVDVCKKQLDRLKALSINVDPEELFANESISGLAPEYEKNTDPTPVSPSNTDEVTTNATVSVNMTEASMNGTEQPVNATMDIYNGTNQVETINGTDSLPGNSSKMLTNETSLSPNNTDLSANMTMYNMTMNVSNETFSNDTDIMKENMTSVYNDAGNMTMNGSWIMDYNYTTTQIPLNENTATVLSNVTEIPTERNTRIPSSNNASMEHIPSNVTYITMNKTTEMPINNTEIVSTIYGIPGESKMTTSPTSISSNDTGLSMTQVDGNNATVKNATEENNKITNNTSIVMLPKPKFMVDKKTDNDSTTNTTEIYSSIPVNGTSANATESVIPDENGVVTNTTALETTAMTKPEPTTTTTPSNKKRKINKGKGKKGKGKRKGRRGKKGKNCKGCYIGKSKSKMARPYQRFNYKTRCKIFRKCKCYCNGKYTCEVEIDRKVC